MTYRNLPPTLYSDIHPTPVAQPALFVYNQALSRELGLDDSVWQQAELLAGNRLPADFSPIAQAYLGHQFGYLTRLGDGRAILLDEVVAPDGRRFDIQLKGSGRTAYSRGGDGRAALGPMLREYLVSEAMHALGIPTSRSLAVVTTGESVLRQDIFPGAILTRVAASHIRVGTFQYAAHKEVVQPLADYTIERHYPAFRRAEQPYLCLLEQAGIRQAELIAAWQAVGFIHGVMNTDNMALSGETIDYGPCAFMDTYRADQVFSSIDRAGRYRYSRQPAIAQWNLARLAESLLELIDPDLDQAKTKALAVLNQFEEHFQAAWYKRFSRKLGLSGDRDESELINRFLALLEQERLDFTNSFWQLTTDSDSDLFRTDQGRAWQAEWRSKLSPDSQAMMKQANPRVIPRNQLLDDALLAAEAGDRQPFDELLQVVTKPFAPDAPEEYTQAPPPEQSFVTYCGT